MPRRLARVALAFAALWLPGSAGAAPPDGQRWARTFEADFQNSASLDAWTAKSGSVGSHAFKRDAANVRLKDGALHLVTTRSPGDGVWATAFVSTKQFAQRYGYYEARLRYASAAGLNNAFWLMSDRSSAEGGQEIDINEGHYPSDVEMSVISVDGKDTGRHQVDGHDLSSEWHEYGLKWDPDTGSGSRLTWYLDGKPVRSVVCRVCRTPARIVLSTAVLPWLHPDARRLSEAEMSVAWVRAYEAAGR